MWEEESKWSYAREGQGLTTKVGGEGASFTKKRGRREGENYRK